MSRESLPSAVLKLAKSIENLAKAVERRPPTPKRQTREDRNAEARRAFAAAKSTHGGDK